MSLPIQTSFIESTLYHQDLSTLRRRDPSIISIFARFNHVAASIYSHEEQKEKRYIEGGMIVYGREAYPLYGFCIMNDQDAALHIQHLYSKDFVSRNSNSIKIQSLLEKGSAYSPPFPSSTYDASLDVYRMSNPDGLYESNVILSILELSAFEEDMADFMMHLHSHIRTNKLYSSQDKLGYGQFPAFHRALSPLVISTPSPGLSTSYSPSTSESPPFSSPPTTPSPSASNPASPRMFVPKPMVQIFPKSLTHADAAQELPLPTNTLRGPEPHQNNKEYRLMALLNSLFAQGHSNSAGVAPRISTPKLVNERALKTMARTMTLGPSEKIDKQTAILESTTIPDREHLAVLSEAAVPRNQHMQRSESHPEVAKANEQSFPISGFSNIHSSGISTDLTELQSCPDLSGQYRRIEQHSFARGGFADIYRGESIAPADHKINVAIKIMRIPGFKDDDHDIVETLNRRLERETKVWNLLHHPNVLPFLGTSHEFGPFPALISPYCPFRDVVSYLRLYPNVTRWPIVLGLTEGLGYLHSQGVVHGDFKGSNVLVGQEGEALICDFGVSKIIGTRGFTTGLFGTPPFMAPELFPDYDMLMDEDAADDDGLLFCPVLTKETDVYAYGLVLLQVLVGKDPKPYYPGAPKAQLLPKRRHYGPVNDRLWALVESCCRLDAKKRPRMDEVTRQITSIADLPKSSSAVQGVKPFPILDK